MRSTAAVRILIPHHKPPRLSPKIHILREKVEIISRSGKTQNTYYYYEIEKNDLLIPHPKPPRLSPQIQILMGEKLVKQIFQW